MSRWLWADIKGRVVNLDRVDVFQITDSFSGQWYVVATIGRERVRVFIGDTEALCQEWLSRQLAYDDAKELPQSIGGVPLR